MRHTGREVCHFPTSSRERTSPVLKRATDFQVDCPSRQGIVTLLVAPWKCGPPCHTQAHNRPALDATRRLPSTSALCLHRRAQRLWNGLPPIPDAPTGRAVSEATQGQSIGSCPTRTPSNRQCAPSGRPPPGTAGTRARTGTHWRPRAPSRAIGQQTAQCGAGAPTGCYAGLADRQLRPTCRERSSGQDRSRCPQWSVPGTGRGP